MPTAGSAAGRASVAAGSAGTLTAGAAAAGRSGGAGTGAANAGTSANNVPTGTITNPMSAAGSSAAAGSTAGRAAFPTAGTPGATAGTAGSARAGAGAAPAAGGGGGAPAAASGETGRMVGMTAAHNAVRARQMNPAPNPALPPLTWSNDLAKIAQAYADKLKATCGLVHSQAPGLGENLAMYGGQMVDPEQVVESWAGEEECYTFGAFMRDDACDMACTTQMSSNGCGHYTQVVWRNTSEVGCGVAICDGSTRLSQEVWVCNYREPGNYVGQKMY